LGVCKNYLIACYGNGLISIFEIDTGKKLVDITGHARWINCMDVMGDKFVTGSEDCFLKLWQITEINHQIKVLPVHSERCVDSLITGVQFNRKNEDICVTCYDSNDILIFKQQ
jgi:WD40 repeat protein